MDQTILETRRFGVIGCEQNKTLGEAGKRMAEEDIGALIVVDEDGFLAGLLTRADLLRARKSLPEWKTQPIKDFMQREVVTVLPNARLKDIADLLLEKQIRHVIVARTEDGKKRPIAMISEADILYHMVQD